MYNSRTFRWRFWFWILSSTFRKLFEKKKITLILHSNCNCKLWKQPLIKFALITFLLSCIATCLLLIENFFHPQKIDIVTFHNACRRFCKCSLSFCDVDFADCLKVLGANLARGWSQRERVFQCLLESILNLTNSNKTTAQRDNTLEAGWVTITKLISWISWLNFFAAN